MGLMQGKQGIIFGLANERSYAWYITRQLLAESAQCYFAHLPGPKMEHRIRRALAELGVDQPWLCPCDVSDDKQLDDLFDRLAGQVEHLDFVVHSVAFADRRFLQIGNFHTTTRVAWNQALEISAYSLLAIVQRAAPLMTRGGSVVAMSYYGGEKVVPGYNIMGIAKAALEHTARYLAAELGGKAIRVNILSGGPLRTLAAMAVGGIGVMFEHHARRSPLRRNIDGDEVGRAAAFLLSDAASGITGEVIHVDSGYHIVGV